MVIADKLIDRSGDARRLLGLPAKGTVDLTRLIEWDCFEVLRNLTFSEIRVSGAEIGLNFVSCRFQECMFEKVRSTFNFWGAGDVWIRCGFQASELVAMIAPTNSFYECRFEDLSLVNFKPHQTLFEKCSFVNSRIEGMKAQLTRNGAIRNQALCLDAQGTVVFRGCRFDHTSFQQCYFDGVVFEACEFVDISARGCDFHGIVSTSQWWGEQKGDPFTVFLSKALDLVGMQCGKTSRAYEAFADYVVDYGAGKTTSKDFSACLYSNKVPYQEVQKVIEELRNLVTQFPF